MANQQRLGFWPVQSPYRFGLRKYTVVSGLTTGGGFPGIAPGEVVTPQADGTIIPYAAGGGARVLGIVASVVYKDATGVKVYGGYLPDAYAYTGAQSILNPNAPIIEVWDDPNIEYMAQFATDSGTPATEFNKVFTNMDVSSTASATAVDTIFKRSNRTLTGTDGGTTATLPFRVLEIIRSPQQDYSATSFLRCKCVINAGVHPFTNTTGI